MGCGGQYSLGSHRDCHPSQLSCILCWSSVWGSREVFTEKIPNIYVFLEVQFRNTFDKNIFIFSVIVEFYIFTRNPKIEEDIKSTSRQKIKPNSKNWRGRWQVGSHSPWFHRKRRTNTSGFFLVWAKQTVHLMFNCNHIFIFLIFWGDRNFPRKNLK